MSPKEIAEKIVKNEALFASIGAKVNSDTLDLARAYLELENKHEYIHNKLLDDIEYQKSEISILKQDLDSEKRNHKIFREAADGYIEKLKKSREALRKFVDHCCSWNEGEVVTGLFDSPWTAREAREALKADDELMKEGEE